MSGPLFKAVYRTGNDVFGLEIEFRFGMAGFLFAFDAQEELFDVMMMVVFQKSRADANDRRSLPSQSQIVIFEVSDDIDQGVLQSLPDLCK